MIVQLDADGLTPVAKNEIFSGTRERARKSDLLTLIYDRLASVPRNDEELRRLNSEGKSGCSKERKRFEREGAEAAGEVHPDQAEGPC